MKIYGIVDYYDNYNGIIKGNDGKDYILNYKYLSNPEKTTIEKGDYVEFIPEEYTTIETKLYIARSVKKIIKESTNYLELNKKRH